MFFEKCFFLSYQLDTCFIYVKVVFNEAYRSFIMNSMSNYLANEGALSFTKKSLLKIATY